MCRSLDNYRIQPFYVPTLVPTFHVVTCTWPQRLCHRPIHCFGYDIASVSLPSAAPDARCLRAMCYSRLNAYSRSRRTILSGCATATLNRGLRSCRCLPRTDFATHCKFITYRPCICLTGHDESAPCKYASRAGPLIRARTLMLRTGAGHPPVFVYCNSRRRTPLISSSLGAQPQPRMS